MITQTLISSLLLAHFTFFVPPKNWKVVPPKKEPIKVAYVGPNKGGLAPSLNLATIPITSDEALYIEKVIERFNKEPKQRCFKIGDFKTKSGRAHLLQIDVEKCYGKMRIWQLILMKGKEAHLMTAVAKKEDFSLYQNDFLTSFSSLSQTEDLFESINSDAIKTHALLLKKPQKMLKFLQKNFSHLGSYWHALCLAELQHEGRLERQ